MSSYQFVNSLASCYGQQGGRGRLNEREEFNRIVCGEAVSDRLRSEPIRFAFTKKMDGTSLEKDR